MTVCGRLRAYANVSSSAGQRERQVLGKAIGSGKTRSRPAAAGRLGEMLGAKPTLTPRRHSSPASALHQPLSISVSR